MTLQDKGGQKQKSILSTINRMRKFDVPDRQHILLRLGEQHPAEIAVTIIAGFGLMGVGVAAVGEVAIAGW